MQETAHRDDEVATGDSEKHGDHGWKESCRVRRAKSERFYKNTMKSPLNEQLKVRFTERAEI